MINWNNPYPEKTNTASPFVEVALTNTWNAVERNAAKLGIISKKDNRSLYTRVLESVQPRDRNAAKMVLALFGVKEKEDADPYQDAINSYLEQVQQEVPELIEPAAFQYMLEQYGQGSQQAVPGASLPAATEPSLPPTVVQTPVSTSPIRTIPLTNVGSAAEIINETAGGNIAIGKLLESTDRFWSSNPIAWPAPTPQMDIALSNMGEAPSVLRSKGNKQRIAIQGLKTYEALKPDGFHPSIPNVIDVESRKIIGNRPVFPIPIGAPSNQNDLKTGIIEIQNRLNGNAMTLLKNGARIIWEAYVLGNAIALLPVFVYGNNRTLVKVSGKGRNALYLHLVLSPEEAYYIAQKLGIKNVKAGTGALSDLGAKIAIKLNTGGFIPYVVRETPALSR